MFIAKSTDVSPNSPQNTLIMILMLDFNELQIIGIIDSTGSSNSTKAELDLINKVKLIC